MTLYTILAVYAIYVISKIFVMYWADKKLREREHEEKSKTRHYKVRVREIRPDRSSLPF